MGWTALHWVALSSENKGANVAELLLAAGAEVNLQDTSNRAALHWAAKNGNADVVKLLLAAGADVNVQSHLLGWTALMRAAENGDADIVEWLIAAGADVNLRNNNGMNAAVIARHNGHHDIVHLIEQAASSE